MKSATLALIIVASGFSETSYAQGSLTPPSGVPAPLMKTLDQIEARTPIPPSPSTPAAGPHFTITQPGSYYLTGNVTVSGGDAISIQSGGVTLDLNGFSLRSTTLTPSGSAILINWEGPNYSGGTTIRNGHIRPFATTGTGTGFVNGILATGLTQNTLVRDITVERLSGDAIHLTNTLGSIAENCAVNDIGGRGIHAYTVRGCVARRIQDEAIFGTTVSDSVGHCLGTARGIGGTNISNSSGQSAGGPGIQASLVLNCHGTSTSNYGIFAAIAQNSYGSSISGSSGLQISGTASYCQGKRNGGVAIQAGIAVACTVDGTGTVSSLQKHLGTP